MNKPRLRPVLCKFYKLDWNKTELALILKKAKVSGSACDRALSADGRRSWIRLDLCLVSFVWARPEPGSEGNHLEIYRLCQVRSRLCWVFRSGRGSVDAMLTGGLMLSDVCVRCFDVCSLFTLRGLSLTACWSPPVCKSPFYEEFDFLFPVRTPAQLNVDRFCLLFTLCHLLKSCSGFTADGVT